MPKVKKGELKAFKTIIKWYNTAITNSAKGEAIAILHMIYMKEADWQSKNKASCRLLQQDLIQTISKLVTQLMERSEKEKLLTDKIWEGFKTQKPRTVRTYFCHKLHKTWNPAGSVVILDQLWNMSK